MIVSMFVAAAMLQNPVFVAKMQALSNTYGIMGQCADYLPSKFVKEVDARVYRTVPNQFVVGFRETREESRKMPLPRYACIDAFKKNKGQFDLIMQLDKIGK